MTPIEPGRDCALCPRLAAFRADNRRAYPDFFNAPVPVWEGRETRLVIVGLAPGLKGANRTGRPFTGDYAGDLLYATLKKAGLAEGVFAARADDGLTLSGATIVNAVRCVPPENKPVGAEIAMCRQFLKPVIDQHHQAVFLALGRIAHDSFLSAVGARRAGFPFGHGARHALAGGTVLYDSFHCSRYNTNTGRLTTEMFEDVVLRAAAEAKRA
ncbi:MAG: uracil-DNA glycosylase [Alphaproteobacteria bacterium]|nr:uracil-DNA glycosylase [Alphaproteobacteria bacterium]